MPHTSSHFLTYRPPPCSNGPVFVFICLTLLPTFSPIGLLHVVMGRSLSYILTYRPLPCSNGAGLCLYVPHTSSYILTYRPLPCSNGPVFVFMCLTLLLTFSPIGLLHVVMEAGLCLTFSPIGLLHVVVGRSLSLCASYFLLHSHL